MGKKVSKIRFLIRKLGSTKACAVILLMLLDQKIKLNELFYRHQLIPVDFKIELLLVNVTLNQDLFR